MKDRMAHIAEDGRTQTVQAHLLGCADLAEGFAQAFGAGELGRLAGLSHDIGKYSAAFQARLQGDTAHVDHSTTGAWECYQRRQIAAALAVAGHHGGLPDWGSKMDTQITFMGRIQQAKEGKLPDASAWKEKIALPDLIPSPMPQREEEMFFARMLYSCLVDADYLDTEAFMDGAVRETGSADIELLWERLQTYIAPWSPPKNSLNVQRCAILRRCMEEGERRSPGLFTLTVPTGGGKTVASLAFALAQARSRGLRRVIYVIPYTSIIEQTADVFRRILGEENVLEHHSGVAFDMDQEADAQTIRHAKATENWDMPVVVTTAVQFFESIYSNRSSKCRKLHSLAQSVVIFDEAQMLPLPYLRPCVFAVAQLVKHYGTSAVLCTATQPALEPLFREFLDQKPVELCPPETCNWELFRRVEFHQAGELSWSQVAMRMNEQKQVLCIVNSRKNAQELFRMLDEDGAYHLSTLMCPDHRSKQLDRIRQRLEAGEPCRVVSTSLIEAGVDVDFPTVYREEAGLDQILQAAGRCNREGRSPKDACVVTVFKSGSVPPPMFRTSIEVARMIMGRHEALDAPETIHDYFQTLLEVKGERALDREGILIMMRGMLFPFRTVAERFRMIDDETRTVYVAVSEGSTVWIDQLRNGAVSRSLYRKLGRCGVNIYERHFQELLATGALELLPDGDAILTDMSLYHDAMGLSLEADSGKALFI